MKTVAEAIHYAHERGILHRDLKPSNVLVDANDQPRVTDFGLAKRFGDVQLSTPDSQPTLTGQVLGSPNYIPPEQASGKRGKVSRQSDVYALGAMLYHLLTGRPPFQGESLTDTLQQVLHTEPLAPRFLNPGAPRDLETICLKCLEKEPSRRYATAQALADELNRFVESKPIQARPLGSAGKTWRWCGRNPRLASAVGAALFSLVIGFAAVTWQWRRAEAHRIRAGANELLARQNAYAADMNLAQRALANNEVEQAIRLLEKYRPSGKSEPDLRHWEWRYLWQQCQEDDHSTLHRYSSGIRSIAVSKDGSFLGLGTWGKALPLWNLATRQPITELPNAASKLAFSPSEDVLAVATRNEANQSVVKVWNTDSCKVAATLTNTVPLQSLAFSPGGKLLATLDNQGTVRVIQWISNDIVGTVKTGPRSGAQGRAKSSSRPTGDGWPSGAMRACFCCGTGNPTSLTVSKLGRTGYTRWRFPRPVICSRRGLAIRTRGLASGSSAPGKPAAG